MEIRIAEEKDLQEMLDIYNYEVKNGVATLDLQEKTLEERREWFEAHNVENHPLYVADVDGHVAGYVSCRSIVKKKRIKVVLSYRFM